MSDYKCNSCCEKEHEKQQERYLREKSRKEFTDFIGEWNKDRLANEWVEFATQWTKDRFGEAECKGCECNEPLEEMQDYIVRCLKEDYDRTMFENYVVPTREYSNKGMTELQELVYLMQETGTLLFPDMKDRVLYTMFNSYNIKYGTQGVREILNHFIIWKNKEYQRP